MKKESREDMSKDVVVEMSSSDMMENHYASLLELLEDRARGLENDEEESGMVYDEVKMIIDELRNIKQSSQDKDDIEMAKKLLKSFKRLLHRHFRSRILEEKKTSIAFLPPAPKSSV